MAVAIKILVLNFFIMSINGANILGIWFHAGLSHNFLGQVLLKELGRRGHNVTMASPFPLKEPSPNYTDIHLTGILEDQLARESMFMKMNEGTFLTAATEVLELTIAQTRLTLAHEEMQKLLKSGIKFDVIVIDWFSNSAILYFGKLFDAPVIPLASHGTSSLVDIPLGNPAPPSYVPNVILPFTPNMTFIQRSINSLFNLGFYVVTEHSQKYHLDLIKQYYNDTVTWEDLKNLIAIILSNSHYSFEPPRPLVPNIIPIGGFHVEKPRKLPNELQEILDKSNEGLIYFSLGSNMKSTLMPLEKQQIFLKVFSKISLTVLWKWEQDDLPHRPKNVFIKKWLPQNDILAHRNTKLFISHGGLLSTIEALYHGVPILGVPIFGDQQKNIATVVNSGRALEIDLQTLNEEKLERILMEILHNPTYAQCAKQGSKLLRDQPLPPLENAVFWVEHVIRHKGGQHLRNFGVHLRWYEYFLLDVIAAALIIFLLFLLTFYVILRKLCRLLKKKIKLD